MSLIPALALSSSRGVGPWATRTDSWTAAGPLAVAVIALGVAVQLNNGAYTPAALALVSVALLCSLFATLSPRVGWLEKWSDRPAVFIMGWGLAVQFGYILSSLPGVYIRGGPEALQIHQRGMALACLLAGAGLTLRPWLRGWRMPILLAVHFALGLWMIASSPDPHIDVFAFHKEAYGALARHANPYAVVMPNIYGHTLWYADGLADSRHVFVGFLYPPLSLLLGWPGHVWADDYRYVMLVAVTFSGVFMAYARPGRLGKVVASLFLFTPRGLFVIEQGWTEPLFVLMLSATVFCACRWPKGLPFAVGFLLAVKQYAIIVLPLTALLLGARRPLKDYIRLFGLAGLVAAAVTLPLALWNIRGFIDSVVVFQGKQPFRADALSYLAWAAQAAMPTPQWLSFATAALAIVLCAFRAPRTPSGFASSAGLVYVVFFAFAKQAFCNYYFMALGVLCCALASLRVPVEE